MAEVRVKIGADIKDLQKGVRDAQGEVGKLADAAQKATGPLNSTGKSIEEIKASAQRAIAESRKLRAELDGVAGSSDVAGGAAADLGDKLDAGFGGAARSAASLGAKIAGGLGIASLAAAAAELRNRFVDAFTAGAKAAEDARSSFASVLSTVADFSRLKGEVAVFENRDDIIRTANIIKQKIDEISQKIEQAGGSADQAEGFLGISAQNVDAIARTAGALFSDAQKNRNRIIDSLKEERGEQQGILDGLTAQLAAYEARQEIGQSLAQAELKTKKEIEGQVVAIKEAAKASEELLKLRAAAFAAVGTPTPFIERGRQEVAKEALPGRSDRVFDETAINDFLASQERIRAQQEAVNAQILQGNDIFTEFGVSGAAALADIALGFENLASLGDIVKNIIRQLIRDLAIAAAKAAILSVLFPGAAQAGGGFGKIFKGLLGIGGGGIDAAPSQSIINAPAAVAPLGRIAQASQSAQIVIPELTIRGNDLVVAFQRARAGSARTLGNIPLK